MSLSIAIGHLNVQHIRAGRRDHFSTSIHLTVTIGIYLLNGLGALTTTARILIKKKASPSM